MNYNKLPEKYEFELNPVSNRTPLSSTPLNFAPSFNTNPNMVPVAKPLSYPQFSQTQPLYTPPIMSATIQPQFQPNPSYLYYPSSGPGYKASASQSFQSGSFVALPKRENYLQQKPNDLYTRTGVIGAMKDSSMEFDDYFETLQNMFFTPEIHEIKLYHTNDYVWGVQVIYRDPWGKSNDKEITKGKPHVGKAQQVMNYTQTTVSLDYDDNIVDVRGSGNSIVKGLRFETLKGKVYEVGCKDNFGENLVPNLAKVVGLGGTHNNFCLESLYFYLI